MSCHRGAAILAGVAAVGVLGIGAGGLLYEGGTNAYLSDSASVTVTITAAQHFGSTGETSTREAAASRGSEHTPPRPRADETPPGPPATSAPNQSKQPKHRSSDGSAAVPTASPSPKPTPTPAAPMPQAKHAASEPPSQQAHHDSAQPNSTPPATKTSP